MTFTIANYSLDIIFNNEEQMFFLLDLIGDHHTHNILNIQTVEEMQFTKIMVLRISLYQIMLKY